MVNPTNSTWKVPLFSGIKLKENYSWWTFARWSLLATRREGGKSSNKLIEQRNGSSRLHSHLGWPRQSLREVFCKFLIHLLYSL